MKLILATLFAFLALSMGFRSRLNNKMFMQNAMETGACFIECDNPESTPDLCERIASLCCDCPESRCAKIYENC